MNLSLHRFDSLAAGAVLGLHAQPYGLIYRRFVRPRLGPPAELEDPAPPRFAQAVGLAFALVALVGLLAGLSIVFYFAIALALAAAFLNTAFGTTPLSGGAWLECIGLAAIVLVASELRKLVLRAVERGKESVK